MHKHLLSIKDLSRPDLEYLLQNAAQKLSTGANSTNFLGRMQVNMFFEESTRTRVSFEMAAKRLGLDVINLGSQGTSIKKGETLLDTARTIVAMQPDLIVLRHSSSGAAAFLAQHLDCHIINAGDGMHAHPTQALLDSLTIQQSKGQVSGQVIAICGDILHSRVARSNILCLSKLGAIIRLVAPSTLIPQFARSLGLEIFHDIKKGIANADVIMMLRLQNERMAGAFIPSIREYSHFYGLDSEKLDYAKPGCLVLHPGPQNRGVEISPELVDSSKVSIAKQVQLGVAIRMSVIEFLLSGR